jgi:hypothetical protein
MIAITCMCATSNGHVRNRSYFLKVPSLQPGQKLAVVTEDCCGCPQSLQAIPWLLV